MIFIDFALILQFFLIFSFFKGMALEQEIAQARRRENESPPTDEMKQPDGIVIFIFRGLIDEIMVIYIVLTAVGSKIMFFPRGVILVHLTPNSPKLRRAKKV